jgi:hypothetical protein
MTHRPGEPAEARIGRDRSNLRQKTDALLQGSGLDISELANALVIHNPHDPGKGRIHITYTRGDVSWERSTWDYLGPLQGYEPDDDPEREPAVDATTIITALTGQTPPSTG